MRRLIAVCIVGLSLSTLAHADAPLDALQWLQRVTAAAQKLTYTGTFVYQSGSQTETSRITHLYDAGNELERIEVLDGSPREVLRRNDEVKCYLPESRLMIVEKRGARQSFPALLPASMAGLMDHYSIRKGSTGRVAGLESQSILIEPKDEFRYGHQLWIDTQSGLLLKSGLVNERGEILESFAFTELRIGIPVDRDSLKPRSSPDDWKVHNVRASEAKGDGGQWQFRAQLPGFRKMSGMRREAQGDMPGMAHVIFSDGLAAISVFIEPMAGRKDKAEVGHFAMGAINVYKRIAGDHLLVAMGDVPQAALKRLVDGVEPKRR